MISTVFCLPNSLNLFRPQLAADLVLAQQRAQELDDGRVLLGQAFHIAVELHDVDDRLLEPARSPIGSCADHSYC